MDYRTKYELLSDGFVMVEMVKVGQDGNGKPEWEETGRKEYFDFSKLPEVFQNGDNVVSLAAYGLSKKLQDTFSALKGSCTFDELAKTYGEFIENVLAQGNWTQKRASGGSKGGSIILFLAQALINAGKANTDDVAAVSMALNKLDKDTLKQLKEAYAEEIAELRKAAETVEIDFS